MGTCYSTNGTTKVRTNNNKPKKTTSCLGSFCNDSESTQSQSKFPLANMPANIQQIKSSYQISYNNDKLNKDLDNLIERYNDKIVIQKINYVQIYNIFMNYIYDFTMSNFLICDTREETKERNQLFLKRFHQINYNLKEIESMSQERLNKFCNFLKNKNIIFILKDESSIEIVEKYIIFFIANNSDRRGKVKNIYILSEYIRKPDENNANSFLEYLYFFIDEDIIYEFSPKILINSIDIKSTYLNYNNNNYINNAYAFINIYPHIVNVDQKNNNNNKIINKFDINYICNKNTEEPDTFLKFISKFKIYYILNFILSKENNINQKSSKYITHSEAKRNKIGSEEKKSLIKQKNISIQQNIQFEDFYRIIQKDFSSIVEEFKNEIIQNNCILIQFDDNIDILFKYKLIFIIFYRITGLSFDEIFNYLKSNFFDIENESLISSKKEEINNLLI
jgi:hypothetical protein